MHHGELMRTLIVFFVLVVAASVCNAQWVQTNGPDSMAMALAAEGTNLLAGTCNLGVFLSTDCGASWTDLGLTNKCIEGLFVSGMNLFAGTFAQGMFRSTDRGASWSIVDSIPTEATVDCFMARGTNLFAAVNALSPGILGGVIRSTNDGTTWIPVNTGLSPETDIAAFAVCPGGTDDTSIFAGGSICEGPCTGCIYRSTNNGTEWTQVSSGLTDSYVGANSFGVIGTDIFAGIGNGVLRSIDNGTRWTRVNSWPTGQDNTSLAVSGTNLFAGTFQGGVFLSTDNGTSWTAVGSGLPPGRWVRSLLIVDANLFAGTESGVWRRPLSEMIAGIAEAHRAIPTCFLLEQNYHNPFNPSTTIHYALPHSSFVTITVHNTLGQQVAQLVNEQQLAGYHNVVFRGDGLASGVYFYRLQAGGFVQTRKMLLVR